MYNVFKLNVFSVYIENSFTFIFIRTVKSCGMSLMFKFSVFVFFKDCQPYVLMSYQHNSC